MSEKRLKDPNQKDNIHLNIWMVPILAGLFAILYGLTDFRGWLILFLGTFGAWMLALLWIRSLLRNLDIQRNIHLAWATVGESVHEQLKVINNSWLPALWVEIVDSSASLEAPVRLVSDVASHSTRTRQPSHLFKRRGLYTLGPTRLRTGDPFGIYTLTIFDQHSSSILITPPILPLSRLRIALGGRAGDERHRGGVIPRNISDAGVRNYIPGDSLRRIHWRATAHVDSLIVRQLEAATSSDWWIIVDLEAATQVGSGLDSTMELSIVLAASLAIRGFKEHRRVGLVLAGPKLVWLEPRADSIQSWRILRALAMAEAGSYPLHDLLKIGRPSQIATLILITPTTEPGWVAWAGRNHRGSNTTALLVDPTDFGDSGDQGQVFTALTHYGIPYARIPRLMLEEAYSPLGRQNQKQNYGIESGKRYLQQERTAWQSLD